MRYRDRIFAMRPDEKGTYMNERIKQFFYRACPVIFRHAIRADKTRQPDWRNRVASDGLAVPPEWLPDAFLALREIERYAVKVPDPPWIFQIKEKFGTLRIYYHHFGKRGGDDPILDEIIERANDRIQAKRPAMAMKMGENDAMRYRDRIFAMEPGEITFQNKRITRFFYRACPLIFRHAIRAAKTRHPWKWNLVAFHGLEVPPEWLPDVFLAMREIERYAATEENPLWIFQIKVKFDTLIVNYRKCRDWEFEVKLFEVVAKTNDRLLRKGLRT